MDESKILFRAKKYRNSVSLAYYTMFTLTRAILLEKGYTPKTHKGIIKLFGEKYVLEEGFNSKIASKFSRSQTIRENTTYSFFDDFNKKTAQETI